MPDWELDPGCNKLKAQVTGLGEQAITILYVIQSRQVQGILGAPSRKVRDPSWTRPICHAEDELELLDQEKGRALQTKGSARVKAGRHEAM